MNEILFFAETLLCFLTTLLAYKLFGKKGLFAWISVAAVIANIETMKLVKMFGMETSLGNSVYAATFLATDILNERYGKEEAKNGMKYGIAGMIVMTVFLYITLLYKPSESDFADESLQVLFTFNVRVTLAALTGFTISSRTDAFLFSLIKEKHGRFLWLRNNVSTIISQFIDTSVFTLISYTGLVSTSSLLSIMLMMFIVKVVLAFLDTPFMYLAVKIHPND